MDGINKYIYSEFKSSRNQKYERTTAEISKIHWKNNDHQWEEFQRLDELIKKIKKIRYQILENNEIQKQFENKEQENREKLKKDKKTSRGKLKKNARKI